MIDGKEEASGDRVHSKSRNRRVVWGSSFNGTKSEAASKFTKLDVRIYLVRTQESYSRS